MASIYLDNNATTKVDESVMSIMNACFNTRYHNPSTRYLRGYKLHTGLNFARDRVGELIQADGSQIFFTSGGTESNNAALRLLVSLAKPCTIITSQIEHKSVLDMAEHLAKADYVSHVTVAPTASGEVTAQSMVDAVNALPAGWTAVVSVMWANNETGVVNDIPSIADALDPLENNVLFHTDAVQAAGKIPLSISGHRIHMVSLSAHKLHGPKGVGALYIDKWTKQALKERIAYGGPQESDLRGGTENVPGIMGFSRAAILALEALYSGEMSKLETMRDSFESTMLAEFDNAQVNGSGTRLPHVSNMSFRNLDSETIIFMADEDGVEISSGSACASADPEPSYVLAAMGVPEDYALGAIRVSLSRLTEEAEMTSATNTLKAIIEQLNSLTS